jgi:hypothetical protein
MINKVLESTQYVVENSTQVSISLKAIRLLSEKVKQNDLSISEIRLAKYNWPFELLLNLYFCLILLIFVFLHKKVMQSGRSILTARNWTGLWHYSGFWKMRPKQTVGF